MSATLSLVIRDGLEADIPACLALDHTYQTDHVWQMRLHSESDKQSVLFIRERLPRTLDTTCPINENRLRAALPAPHGFIVAADRNHGEIYGYLTARHDSVYQIAHIQDLVISRPYRQRRIGTKLLNIARQWARECGLLLLTVEVQTRNYPAITFCQHSGLIFSGFNDHYFPDQDIAVFFSQSLR
jgi:GNAT superfamily N-acetyltransferase